MQTGKKVGRWQTGRQEDRQIEIGVGWPCRPYIQNRGLVLTILIYSLLWHLERVVVCDRLLAVPKHVDEGVLRLELGLQYNCWLSPSSSSGGRRRRAISSALNPNASLYSAQKIPSSQITMLTDTVVQRLTVCSKVRSTAQQSRRRRT